MGTPPTVVERLNTAVNQLLRTPEFAKLLLATDGEPAGGSSEEFRKFVVSEIARWAVAVKDSGARPD